MHPKMVIGHTGFEKGQLQSTFLKQSKFSDRSIIQKVCSMSLYDIRGKLYENTIHETDYTITRYKGTIILIYEAFEYTVTRYKGNSVYDNTLGCHV